MIQPWMRNQKLVYVSSANIGVEKKIYCLQFQSHWFQLLMYIKNPGWVKLSQDGAWWELELLMNTVQFPEKYQSHCCYGIETDV